MLFADSRLSAWITTALPAASTWVGCKAKVPMAAAITLMAMTARMQYRKMTTGSGRRLPPRSIQPRMPPVLLLSVMESVVMVRSFGNPRL